LRDRRSARTNRALRDRPSTSALPEATPAADESTSSPSSVLLRAMRSRCRPISPLPDVSSVILSGTPLTAPDTPGNRASDNDASAAMTQSRVSSGEKNEVNLNGGRKGRSLPASLNSEGRIEEEGESRSTRNGNVCHRTMDGKGSPFAKEGCLSPHNASVAPRIESLLPYDHHAVVEVDRVARVSAS
jgi:hypothetical protein